MDHRARAAARARLAALAANPGALGRLEELGVWLAGVTGDDPPAVRARLVLVEDPAGAPAVSSLARAAGAEVVLVGADPRRTRDAGIEPALSVGEVAAAVDRGRDLAAAAARDGATVLLGGATRPHDTAAAARLAAALTGTAPEGDAARAALTLHVPRARGPLGLLRRLGSADLAVLCGLALGAGEQGLGFVCDGLVATTAAAVAAAVEPGLRPRLLSGHRADAPGHAVLLEHLGLEPVLDLGLRVEDGSGALAALAVLRVAAA